MCSTRALMSEVGRVQQATVFAETVFEDHWPAVDPHGEHRSFCHDKHGVLLSAASAQASGLCGLSRVDGVSAQNRELVNMVLQRCRSIKTDHNRCPAACAISHSSWCFAVNSATLKHEGYLPWQGPGSTYMWKHRVSMRRHPFIAISVRRPCQ